MNTRDLFLRAAALCPLDEAAFFGHLGDLLAYLAARYPLSLLTDRGALVPPTTLDEECPLSSIYFGALVRGLVARVSGSERDEAQFRAEAEAAYISCWRAAAARRRVGDGGERHA